MIFFEALVLRLFLKSGWFWRVRGKFWNRKKERGAWWWEWREESDRLYMNIEKNTSNAFADCLKFHLRFFFPMFVKKIRLGISSGIGWMSSKFYNKVKSGKYWCNKIRNWYVEEEECVEEEGGNEERPKKGKKERRKKEKKEGKREDEGEKVVEDEEEDFVQQTKCETTPSSWLNEWATARRRY